MKLRRNRGRLLRSFIPAMVLALFVIGIGAAAAAENAALTGGATVNIEIGDNVFNPASVNVNVGDTVVWTHKGQRPHDVTADGGAFNSPRRMANGQTFSYTATAAGVINYVCTIHTGMNGVLNVQGAPAATPRTGGGGMATALGSWQQLVALGVVLVGGSAALVALRRRSA